MSELKSKDNISKNNVNKENINKEKNIPITIIREQCYQEISKAVSDAISTSLPLFIIDDILLNIKNEVHDLAIKQLNQDMVDYQKKLNK